MQEVTIWTMFYCLLYLSCSGCDVMSLYFLCFSVNVPVCLICCVLESVCELFGETIRDVCGVVTVLLLNDMDVFSVCWIDRVWSSTECACSACDPCIHLSVLSICLVCSDGLCDGLCVFRELCPVIFLVVGESPSVLM